MNNIALKFGNLNITYEELHTRIDEYARALYKRGVRENDIIAVSVANTPEAIYLSYALNKKIEELFCSEREKISVAILAYVLKTDEKQKVYDYISNLKDKNHLQTLYFNFFAKSKDIDLDLAFVKNETEIVNDYKEYINSQITYNWKDLKLIKYLINSSGVLRIIGHIDYRNVLERIEKLENEVDFNATVAKILEVSRNAEKIAKEAKAIARSK